MIRGACLCGGIRFEVDRVRVMVHCHCSMCRKATGAAFGTFAHALYDDFRFTAGEDLLRRYESSPGNERGFCSVCGSTVPAPQRERPSVPIGAGLLEDDPGLRPAAHIFTGSMASWWDIDDDLPCFEEMPPAPGMPGGVV